MWHRRLTRLKDPALIARWERLVPYARQTPARPQAMAYRSVTGDDDVLAVRQNGAPSFVYFMKVPVAETERTLDGGGTAVMREYKISTRYPMVFAYPATIACVSDRRGRWRREKDILKSAWLFLRTGHLIASAEEMDELIAHLDASEAEVFTGMRKKGKQ